MGLESRWIQRSRGVRKRRSDGLPVVIKEEPMNGHRDLRDFINQVRDLGELESIEGAD